MNSKQHNHYHQVTHSELYVKKITVGIKNEHDGWFEVYDIETGGDDWYAEGCLDFDGMDLVGYDGCFCLPDVVIDKLKSLGYKDDL